MAPFDRYTWHGLTDIATRGLYNYIFRNNHQDDLCLLILEAPYRLPPFGLFAWLWPSPRPTPRSPRSMRGYRCSRRTASFWATTPSRHLRPGQATASDRLRLSLMLLDLTKSGLEVGLRFKLEAPGIRMATAPDYRGVPFYLDGGQQLMLEGHELADYFLPQNMVFPS
ncbi:MAG: hypothetical protein HC819_18320 [Cyclobacteriaceae bacterium]|nr:hypothetical protein [Cyclobacteriaceae bacterium]